MNAEDVQPPGEALARERVALDVRVRDALASLGDVARPGRRSAPTPLEDDAAGLRLALALRGHADPVALLPNPMGEERRLAALDAVADEADTGPDDTPAPWQLTDAARRAALTALDPSQVSEALTLVRDGDAVTQALRRAYGLESADAEALDIEALRAQLFVEPAILGHAPAQPDPAELRRRLAARRRVQEYEAVVQRGLVGRDRPLGELLEFCAFGGATAELATHIVWGVGGIGKSSLATATLLHALREMPHVVPFHLDLDRSDLDVVEGTGLTLEVLRQAGLAEAERDAPLKQRRHALRQELLRERNEGPSSQESAKRGTASLLHGALTWIAERGRVAVVVLDSFEQVEAAGAGGLEALARWLAEVTDFGGLRPCRLIVAGRGDPGETGAAAVLRRFGPVAVTRLDELAATDAEAFLTQDRGVPTTLAATLVRALGGNPLLLGLAADLVKARGEAAMAELARDASEGRIPAALVQGVLYDRFLKHLPNEAGERAYAHPGLVLPRLDVALIRDLLGPLRGEAAMLPERAKQVFEALAAAHWLVRREGDALVQRPDLRRLMLRLMAADPDRAAEVVRVRAAAILYHAGRRDVLHRASLAYHVLMGVSGRDDLALVDLLDLDGCGPFLRRHLEDLPEAAQTFVLAVDFGADPRGGAGLRRRLASDARIAPERALRDLPDPLWEAFIAGDGDAEPGEGNRLADEGDPARSLDLWRHRPVGPPGRPPTFVLRALAEAGDWDTGEADLAAIVAGLPEQPVERGGQATMPLRLHWAARLLLLADPGAFGPERSGREPVARLVTMLRLVLRDTLHQLRPGTGFDVPAQLCAVVDGLLGEKERDFLPFDRRVFPQGALVRLHWRLALRLLLRGGPFAGRFHSAGVLVTEQRDFAERARGHAAALGALWPGGFDDGAFEAGLRAVDERLRAAHGAPLTQGQRDLPPGIDGALTVETPRWSLRPEERAAVRFFLRSPLQELHRPARAALVTAFRDAGEARLRRFAEAVAPRMTVLPAQFEPGPFAALAARDPAGWFLTLVEYADRAAVLESVLLAARDSAPRPAPLDRVLATLIAWDRALNDGHSSDWWGEEHRRQVGEAGLGREVPPSATGETATGGDAKPHRRWAEGRSDPVGPGSPEAEGAKPMSRITEDGHHGRGPRHDMVPPRGVAFRAGRFGRMVPELASPLEPPDGALVDLGLSMVDGPQGKESGDNENIPAGFTYLGQFIDHDITLDTTNLGEVSQDPAAVENFRTPRLDLDSVYGFGPRAQPSLYDRASKGRAKLLVGATVLGGAEQIKAGLLHDLPRNAQGFAIIGDERNDENLLVAQTHLAFLRFHNAIVDRLDGEVPDGALFARARRAAVDLYQSMVVRDFLTRICDPNDVAAAIERRRFFRFEHFGAFQQPYMPVEFSAAAYRLGHSMVREVYSHNRIFTRGGVTPATLQLLFDFTAKSGDLGTEGQKPSNRPTLPGDWIVDWRRFLEFGAENEADRVFLNLTRNIDPYLAPELHMLGNAPRPGADSSLAVMNLRRGVKMKLPAAQHLARFMGVPVLAPDEIAASGPDGEVAEKHGLHARTPLWYYILKEAELRGGGKRLGPLGSLIVAETFIGLLQGDPESILARDPSWRLGDPVQNLVLPGADKSFTFADLVAVGAGGRTKAKLSPVDDPETLPAAPANEPQRQPVAEVR